MIVVNMWFIRHSNGLFHYGLDYSNALADSIREVWTRDAELASLVRQRLPGVNVHTIKFGDFLSAIIRVRRNGDFVFTPSSHPLGLLPRQVVVIHDSFPFKGRGGAIKLALFRAGLAISGALVAYVNRADGGLFLAHLGLAKARTRYLPNSLPPPIEGPNVGPLLVGDRLVVGLFGSDSPKKNYHELFAAFSATPRSTVHVMWRIFGHDNAYTASLRLLFPKLEIEVVPSDESSMQDFLSSIDLAVSGASGEGFARPIASALILGIPTMLLDTPVFREFYAESAQLFETIDALTSAIAALRPGALLARPYLASEKALRNDFAHAVVWLKSK